jgi:predicted polyphosphate/ATP-dependent NAD kinase
MARLGFIINPIAGMGGRVGLKGTDGAVAEAEQRGAERGANARALAMLQRFRYLLKTSLHQPTINWLTAHGEMGCDVLRARDVCTVTGEATPVLGIPAGVKMYSGVFGITPAHTAEILLRYLGGEIGLARVEILDLDEERYRRDDWAVRLYMSARAPFDRTCVQVTLQHAFRKRLRIRYDKPLREDNHQHGRPAARRPNAPAP